MCEYENRYIEKPVSPILRRNMWRWISIDTTCEKNEYSCSEYQLRRKYIRLNVSGNIGQMHLSKLVNL